MDTNLALIGDVQQSRSVANFARHRDRALAGLSRSHRDAGWIDADYAVTAWDEFQGLITEPAAVPRIVWALYKAFQPMKLKLALGGGAVERHDDSGGVRDQPINQTATGEAFILARAALERLTERRHGAGRARIAVAWNDPGIEAALNAAFRLIDVLVDGITAKQWEVIELYEAHPHQGEVAARLGKSESTISRSLAAASYWDIQAGLDDVETFLENCTKKYITGNLHTREHLWL